MVARASSRAGLDDDVKDGFAVTELGRGACDSSASVLEHEPAGDDFLGGDGGGGGLLFGDAESLDLGLVGAPVDGAVVEHHDASAVVWRLAEGGVMVGVEATRLDEAWRESVESVGDLELSAVGDAEVLCGVEIVDDGHDGVTMDGAASLRERAELREEVLDVGARHLGRPPDGS